MPFYDYHCENCGNDLEVLQKISDPVLTDCPKCHQPALKKRIATSEFRLKGDGWYETDFKKEGRRHLHQGDKPASSSSD